MIAWDPPVRESLSLGRPKPKETLVPTAYSVNASNESIAALRCAPMMAAT